MMEWIDREVQFPDCERILCYGDGEVFISELVESKRGNYYCAICDRMPEWTHWIAIPNLPTKERGR